MYNNASLLVRLDDRLQHREKAPLKPRVPLDPCLPSRLPSLGFISREAEQLAPRAFIKQLRHTPPASPDVSSDEPSSPTPASEHSEEGSPRHERNRTLSISSVWSTISAASSLRNSTKRKEAKPWKVEPYQILRAVERRDITFLMEVRERDFELLLRKTGDVTPLLHAMRVGHQDVAIILLGAFSRYINNLQDDEIALPRTKTRLKALRINLKLAIDYGLQTSQSDLIASFLQTLIMSEGDQWVLAQVASISGALREGTTGRPVEQASNTVRKFATKQLGKADTIAALEDYVANATADLLLMAAWSSVLDTIEGEPIPTYYFARDDRVYKAFVDRLDLHKRAIERTCTRRLRWQLRVLRAVMEGRTTSYRSKVDTLAEEFDQGPGV
ncbi:hypothetical protein NM688_g89 [Phlebia brevispora]|uniref:Uncharacterized protein n=1 Tax=Phlebia brevispora TaxID=194682 RepID=A0ACC1TFE3_9APHY|nr:hypothetical protein NM688_g89 [Phlebia brevispora]